MKVLLTAINAKYIHSNPAVYSLKAYAAEFGAHIEIVEYTINNQTEAILADLFGKNPDVIAFSCYIWNWNVVRELLEDIGKVLPKTDVWLGGPEVSYDSREILRQYPIVRGIMCGEGEETFLELMKYYCLRDRKLQDISGLELPEGNTGKREFTDLNKIPFFYQDMKVFSNRIVYYESSRGCPFRCSYCLSSIDKTVRFRNIDKVKSELQFFLDRKIPQVKFVDRTFNCSRRHAMAVWQYILENDNGVTNFHFEISADLIGEEELDVLRKMRPGLLQFEIGVQTTNPETLAEIRRQSDFVKLRNVVEHIQKNENIHVHLDLIAGLPYENYERFILSFNEVYAMKPGHLQLGFLKVLKGSYMHEKAKEYELCYRSEPPYELLCSKWISYEEILKLKNIEKMVELYYNSSQFRHTLNMLETVFPHAFAMYEALAGYYEGNGFFENNPARSYRYEILLQFSIMADEKREELYRQLLTYDMYLREKCKSRPVFAKDLSFCYREIRGKMKTKTEHIDRFDYPVWEKDAKKACEKLLSPVYVRFLYEKRNPLTGECRTEIIE